MLGWNVKGESSSEDDEHYISTTLVEHLSTFDNVEPSSFTLYGFSNGAALTNRILIENDDPRIAAAITDGSQLNTLQFHGGRFYIGGGSNEYTSVKGTPFTRRRLLQMVGGQDHIIPARGGASRVGDAAHSNRLVFVDWEASALAFAVAYGYTGGVALLSPDDSLMARASYLDGQVQAYIFKNVGHVSGPSNALARRAISSFLGLSFHEDDGGGPSDMPFPAPAADSDGGGEGEGYEEGNADGDGDASAVGANDGDPESGGGGSTLRSSGGTRTVNAKTVLESEGCVKMLDVPRVVAGAAALVFVASAACMHGGRGRKRSKRVIRPGEAER
jgi:hypothetical protein